MDAGAFEITFRAGAKAVAGLQLVVQPALLATVGRRVAQLAGEGQGLLGHLHQVLALQLPVAVVQTGQPDREWQGFGAGGQPQQLRHAGGDRQRLVARAPAPCSGGLVFAGGKDGCVPNGVGPGLAAVVRVAPGGLADLAFEVVVHAPHRIQQREPLLRMGGRLVGFEAQLLQLPGEDAGGVGRWGHLGASGGQATRPELPHSNVRRAPAVSAGRCGP